MPPALVFLCFAHAGRGEFLNRADIVGTVEDTIPRNPETATGHMTIQVMRDPRPTFMPDRHCCVPDGRVGDWRAGLGRSLCSLLARSFVCECHTISAVPRFQPPPRRTQHADFPHCALLFASPQGLWGLSCRSGFRRWSNHSIAIEQLQSLVRPSPTPPRPAEALSVPG